MANEKDHISRLYDALLKKGISDKDMGGSVDNFRKGLKDPKIRRNFYDWASRDKGINLGTEDSFGAKIAEDFGEEYNPKPERTNSPVMNTLNELNYAGAGIQSPRPKEKSVDYQQPSEQPSEQTKQAPSIDADKFTMPESSLGEQTGMPVDTFQQWKDKQAPVMPSAKETLSQYDYEVPEKKDLAGSLTPKKDLGLMGGDSYKADMSKLNVADVVKNFDKSKDEYKEKTAIDPNLSASKAAEKFISIAKGFAGDENKILNSNNFSEEQKKELINRVHTQQKAKLEELLSVVEARSAEEEKKIRSKYSGAITPFAGGIGNSDILMQQDPELKSWAGSERQLRDAIKLLDNAISLKKSEGVFDGFFDVGNNLKNFGKGALDKATDLRTWDFGATDLSDASASLRISKKLESGTPLTESEKTYALLSGINNDIQQQYAEDLPRMYGAGQTTVQMAPFMWQMAANPGTLLEGSLVSKAVEKYGKEGVKSWLARAGAHIVEDAASSAILAGTLQIGQTASNVANRMAGTAQLDENGNPIYTEKESGLEALYKGVTQGVIENFTEMMGEYAIPTRLFKGTGDLAKKVGLGRVVNWFEQAAESDFNMALRNFEKQTKWSGNFGELLEEEYGIILNRLLGTSDARNADGSKQTYWEQLKDIGNYTSLDEQIDIALGVGCFGAFMSGLHTVGGINTVRKIKTDLDTAEGNASKVLKDEWDGIKEAINSAEEKNLATTIRQIAENKKPEEVAAILQYAGNLSRWRGINIGLETSKESKDNISRELISSYSNGIDLEGADINKAGKVNRDAREALINLENGEEMASIIDAAVQKSDLTGITTALRLAKTEEEKKAAEAYAISSLKIAGASTTARSAIEAKKNNYRTTLEDYSEKSGDANKQKLVGATLLGLTPNEQPKEVWVINNNGSTATVRDKETGEVHMATSSRVTDTYESSVEQEVADWDANEGQQMRNDFFFKTMHHENTHYLQPGETIQTEDGNVLTFQQSFGPYDYFVDVTGQIVPMPTEETLALQDAANYANDKQAEVEQQAVQAQEQQNIADSHTNDAESALTSIEGGQKLKEQIDALVSTNKDLSLSELMNQFNSTVLSDYSDGQLKDAARAYMQSLVEQEQAGESQAAVDEAVASVEQQSQEALAPVQSQEEQTAETQGEESAVQEVPRDADGNVDYDKIEDAQMWADAAREEFGEDAYDTALSEISNVQKELDKLKGKSGIDINRKKNRLKARIKMLTDAANILAPKDADTSGKEGNAVDGADIDITMDTPAAARERGYVTVNGNRVDRKGAVTSLAEGNEAEVRFGSDNADVAKAKYVLLNVKDVAPSHRNKVPVPEHFFLSEGQPKERTDEASQTSVKNIATNPNETGIVGMSAYEGAPVINARGEVIQGNNRQAGFEQMTAEAEQKYREMLKQHAAEFGFTAEQIDQMPVGTRLYRLADVADEEAIRLGNKTRDDMESGGTQHITPANTAQLLKSSGKVEAFVKALLVDPKGKASIKRLIRNNGANALIVARDAGAISQTQYISAIDGNGITDEASSELEKLVTMLMLGNVTARMKQGWDALDEDMQTVVLYAYAQDQNAPNEAKLMPEILNAIELFGWAQSYPNFARSNDLKSALETVKGALAQTSLVESQYSFKPIEVLFAAEYQGADSKTLKTELQDYYDKTRKDNTGQMDMFGNESVSKDEAIEQVWGIGEVKTEQEEKITETTPDSATTQEDVKPVEENKSEQKKEKPVEQKTEEKATSLLTEKQIRSLNLDPVVTENAIDYINGDNGITKELAYKQAQIALQKWATDYVNNGAEDTTYELNGEQIKVQDSMRDAGFEILDNGGTYADIQRKLSIGYKQAKAIEDAWKKGIPVKKEPNGAQENLFDFAKRKIKEAKDKKSEEPKSIDEELAEALGEFKTALADFKKKGKKNKLNVSLIGLTNDQIEALGDLFVKGARVGYVMAKKGAKEFEQWVERMMSLVGDAIKDATNWSDEDVREFLSEVYNNTKIPTDNGHVTTIKESVIAANIKDKLRAKKENKTENTSQNEEKDVTSQASITNTNGEETNEGASNVRGRTEILDNPSERESRASQQNESGRERVGDGNSNGVYENNEGVQELSNSTFEEGSRRQQPNENGALGGSKQDESKSTDGERVDRGNDKNSTLNENGSDRVSGASESQSVLNSNNYRAEGGKIVTIKSPQARLAANISAIKLMQELSENGEKATPEQMRSLALFSGWGGLGGEITRAKQELTDLIGEEQYQAVALSANSSYYTPDYVIDALWTIAEKLGVKGGKILEGSAGIGSILSLMPEGISANSNIHAVEIDPITGGILKLLYPDAKVDIDGFQNVPVDNGSVDLAITNVPFVSGLAVTDKAGDKDLSKMFRNLHDYCIAKNVRKLAPGGVGIFITTSGTMDKSKELRSWLVNQGNADVIGAFRLNNSTFGDTGAKVTSDIIVIRKRVNFKKAPNAIDVSNVNAERYEEVAKDKAKANKDGSIPMDRLPLTYNQYFIENPDNMAGVMDFGFNHGDEYRPKSISLYPVDGKNQLEMLDKWANSFEAVKDEALTKEEFIEILAKQLNEKLGADVKEGSLLVNSKGEICVARLGNAVPLDSKSISQKIGGKYTKQECLKDYKAVMKSLQNVLDYEMDNDTDEGLKTLLIKLSKDFDTFTRKYGHVMKAKPKGGVGRNTSLSFLRNDTDFANFLALESVVEDMDAFGNKNISYKKSDIFTKRVVEKAKEWKPTNARDGVFSSLYKFGNIELGYIADALGKTEEEVKKEILESGLAFEDPTTNDLIIKHEYLSGNVREKLDSARDNNKDGKYDNNIKELEKVVPMDIPSHLIEFNLGSTWIDKGLFEDYIYERTGRRVKLNPVGGTWEIEDSDKHKDGADNAGFGVYSKMFDKSIYGTQLIEAAMKNASMTVSRTYKDETGTHTETDKEATQACSAKISEIKQDFKDYLRERMQNEPELASALEKKYNYQFNNFVPKTIPSEFVPEHFEGQVTEMGGKEFKLYPHQGSAVVRATTEPLMLAHEVGTGKTFTLITTAMEMRRMGMAKKPMIVVQNATVSQFVADAKKLYPAAKVLTIEDSDKTAEGRKNFYAKIKYNDWDMIVVPQSVFNMIPDSEDRQIDYIQQKIEEKLYTLEAVKDGQAKAAAEREIEALRDEIAELVDKKSTKKNARQEALATEKTKVKAEEMLDRKVDAVENFDQMGIDALLIDEAHEYKHLGFATAMTRGVKGVDPSYSKKSQGLYLKVQAVKEDNNGKNIVFATGTPISNTAAEVWTFMRYLMPRQMMEAYGIYYFDDFARNFGNIAQMLEFTTSGKFKENNRFSGYVNLPELRRLWGSVADVQLAKNQDKVQEKIPSTEEFTIDKETGKRINKATQIFLPQTRSLRSIMVTVRRELEEFEKMDGAQKKANSHIPLVKFGIASKAAIDPRLVSRRAIDEPNSKTNRAVDEIIKDLVDTAEYNGTCALFSDNFQRTDIATDEEGNIIYQKDRNGNIKRDKNDEPIPMKVVGFNLYDEIKRKLVERGVPENQIAIIRSGMSLAKKQDIFDKVNSGEIRVIMGSTQTLGTGVNIQERLHLLINMDVPARPLDYTQRLGRILRQGNIHKLMGKTVRVLNFGVEDSLDVTGYQRLDTKGKIVKSMMNDGSMMANNQEDRTIEEEDEEGFGDATAILSGSQYALLKNKAERDVRKFEGKKAQWEADQIFIHSSKPRLKGIIKANEDDITVLTEQLSKIKEAFPDGISKIKVGKQEFESIESMAEFFKVINKKQQELQDKCREDAKGGMDTHSNSTYTVEIGPFKFNIRTNFIGFNRFDPSKRELVATSSREMNVRTEDLKDADDYVNGGYFKNAIEYIVNEVLSGNIYSERIGNLENANERYKKDLESLESREGKPFQYGEELEKAKADLADYTEKMKEEMAEKEAKYKEMDSEVKDDTFDINEVESEDEEDNDGEDDEGRYSLRDEQEAEYISTKEEIEEAINTLSDALNTDIEVLHNEQELESSKLNESRKSVIRREGMGYYDIATGKVYIYIPNIMNADEAIATVLHEVVGHKGLRKMFGGNYDKAMAALFSQLPDDAKKEIIDKAAKEYGYDVAEAMDEYLAEIAEKNETPTWWDKVRAMFGELLRRIGLDVEISDNDIKYLLWQSRNMLKKEDAYSFAKQSVMRAKYGINVSNMVKARDYLASSGVMKGASYTDVEGRHSKVTDKVILKRFETEPTIKVYRTMQVINGKLYPPMQAAFNGELVEGLSIGDVDMAEEHPELAREVKKADGSIKYVFDLDTGSKNAMGKKGKTSGVLYDPYLHAKDNMLNDQFSAAWIRPNLVTVEMEMLVSDLESGYHAEKAALPVGKHPWKPGEVANKLIAQGAPLGQLYLSRFGKITRIVPNDEVAQHIKGMLDGTDIGIPENVVTPQLYQELVKAGVKVEGPQKQYADKKAAYEEAIEKGLTVTNELDNPDGTNGGRFSKKKNSSSVDLVWHSVIPSELRVDKEGLYNAVETASSELSKRLSDAEKKGVKFVTTVAYYGGNIYFCTVEGENFYTEVFDAYPVNNETITRIKDAARMFLDSDSNYIREALQREGLSPRYDSLIFSGVFGESFEEAGDMGAGLRGKGYNSGQKRDGDKIVRDSLRRETWKQLDASYVIAYLKGDLESARVYLEEAARRNGVKLSEAPEITKRKDGSLIPLSERFIDQKYKGRFKKISNSKSSSTDSIQQMWDAIASSTPELLETAMVDQYHPVKSLQRLYASKFKKAIPGYQDVYGELSKLGGVNRSELDKVERTHVTPLIEAINDLLGDYNPKKVEKTDGQGKKGDWDWVNDPELRRLTTYLQLKHGIERNRDMAVRKELKRKATTEYNNDVLDIKEKYETALTNAITSGDSKEEASIRKQIRDEIKALPSKQDRYEEKLNKFYADINTIRNNASLKTWEDKQKKMDEVAKKLGADVNDEYAGVGKIVDELVPGTSKQDTRDAAYALVNQYEADKTLEKVQPIHDALIGMSSYILAKQQQTGLVDEAYIKDQARRYEFYVPLRGFDEPTADQMYNYIEDTSGYEKGNPVKKANGRGSIAANPLANMMSVLNNTIVYGNRNMALQRFYNLVNAHPSGLAKITQRWLVNEGDEDNPVWEEKYPVFDEKDDASTIAQTLEDFNAEMRELKKQGKAMTISEAAGKIPYRTLGEMKSDHIVKVSIGGRRFEIVVAGDPLVSQALSGKLNPNSKDTWLQTLNRWRAGLFTSYNISFAARNLRKDSQYAQLNVMTNDGAFSKKYIKFLWHRGGALGMMDMLGIPHPGFVGQLGTAFRLRSMLKAYESGKPDAKLANSKTYKQFVEFMDNGGATGYAWSEDVRGARERFEKLYKQAARATLNPKNLGKLLKEFVSLTTGASELVQRFAVYQTEREFGGTISKAINRAKDVTLNFERKGAGMKIAGKNRNKLVNATAWANDIGRNYFMFFNANVQGKYQMAKLAKEHPARFTAAVAWPALLSAVILPILNEALLGGDDDESYYDLSEYDRQNFLCVRKPGGGWIKLPYSPELAPFAGVGDIIGASARGELTGNALWRSISKVSSAAASTCVDLDNVLAGGDKGEWEMRGRELLGSTALGPMADYMFNRNFMGGKVRKETYNEMQKNDPEYTKGTKRTNESLKWLTERLNRLTGGDNVDSGWVDVNPALLQTALEGYTGGWGSVALGITDFFATSGDKSLKIEQAPIVGGFMRSGGSNAREERVDQNYYRTVKRFMDEQHRRELRVNALLESNNEEDVFEGYAKSEKLANDKDYMKYNDFEQTGFADMIKQLEKLEKETGIEQPELRQYKEEAIKWFRNYE